MDLPRSLSYFVLPETAAGRSCERLRGCLVDAIHHVPTCETVVEGGYLADLQNGFLVSSLAGVTVLAGLDNI